MFFRNTQRAIGFFVVLLLVATIHDFQVGVRFAFAVVDKDERHGICRVEKLNYIHSPACMFVRMSFFFYFWMNSIRQMHVRRPTS